MSLQPLDTTNNLGIFLRVSLLLVCFHNQSNEKRHTVYNTRCMYLKYAQEVYELLPRQVILLVNSSSKTRCESKYRSPLDESNLLLQTDFKQPTCAPLSLQLPSAAVHTALSSIQNSVCLTCFVNIKALLFPFIMCSVSPDKRRKMESALEQLKKHTVVVADTGDFNGTRLDWPLYTTSQGQAGIS